MPAVKFVLPDVMADVSIAVLTAHSGSFLYPD